MGSVTERRRHTLADGNKTTNTTASTAAEATIKLSKSRLTKQSVWRKQQKHRITAVMELETVSPWQQKEGGDSLFRGVDGVWTQWLPPHVSVLRTDLSYVSHMTCWEKVWCKDMLNTDGVKKAILLMACWRRQHPSIHFLSLNSAKANIDMSLLTVH